MPASPDGSKRHYAQGILPLSCYLFLMHSHTHTHTDTLNLTAGFVIASSCKEQVIRIPTVLKQNGEFFWRRYTGLIRNCFFSYIFHITLCDEKPHWKSFDVIVLLLCLPLYFLFLSMIVLFYFFIIQGDKFKRNKFVISIIVHILNFSKIL